MKLNTIIEQIRNFFKFNQKSSYEIDLSQFHLTYKKEKINNNVRSNSEPLIISELENPLMPFYVPISSSMVQQFQKQKRPLSIEEHKSIFEQHICIKNFLHEDKSPILKKIWEDSKFIYDALLPLKNLNLNFTIDLTGGCVRDFVLNHHHEIKDLDIMISIYSDQYYFLLGHEHLLSEFSAEELESISWNDRDTDKDKKVKLIKLCMERTQDISKIYFFSDAERLAKVVDEKPIVHQENGDEQDDDYITSSNREASQDPDRILGVIQTSGKHTHYPIDLLITDLIKPAFIDAFDFDICKASFCINNSFYDKSFPKNYSHLISRFVAPPSFWADVYHQTINYDVTKRSMKQLNTSFGSHLERLIKKYPTYTTRLSYEPTISNKAYDYIWEYAEGQLKVRTLDIKLSSKEHVKVKKTKL